MYEYLARATMSKFDIVARAFYPRPKETVKSRGLQSIAIEFPPCCNVRTGAEKCLDDSEVALSRRGM
jgi:hypothetical protein